MSKKKPLPPPGTTVEMYLAAILEESREQTKLLRKILQDSQSPAESINEPSESWQKEILASRARMEGKET